jgi:hypothetical protein
VVLCPAMSSHGGTSTSQPESVASGGLRIDGDGGRAAYRRALILGTVAALLGLILYSTVAIVIGLVSGFASLAAGYIIGKAMMVGSGGIGGRKYQITAAILTYAAVSMSFVPIVIDHQMKTRPAPKATQEQLAEEQRQLEKEFGQTPQIAQPKSSRSKTEVSPPRTASPTTSWAWFGHLLFVGILSPIYDLQYPKHGVVGLVILAIGISIAWRITAGTRLLT